MMAERETQTRRPHRAKRSLLSFLLALALAAGALVGVTAPADAAGLAGHPGGDGSSSAPMPLTGFTPPADEGAAIAEMATVRVVTDYKFTYTLAGAPVAPPLGAPTDGYCTGEGVLVSSPLPDLPPSGTTPAGTLAVLTDNTVINQSAACTGDFPSSPTGFLGTRKESFQGATLYLSSAYSSGAASGQTKVISLEISGSLTIHTISGGSLILVEVPVPSEAGKTFRDYPTVNLAMQASTTQDLLALTNAANASLTSKQMNNGTAPQEAKQFLMPQANAYTGVVPTGTAPGTPIIDTSTGDLTGMVDGAGTVVAATQDKIDLSVITNFAQSCPTLTPTPDCLSHRWKQAMDAFYSTPSHSSARPLLSQIVRDYPDFVGAQDFLQAATPPNPTPQSASKSVNNSTFVGVPIATAEKIALGILLVLLALVVALAAVIYVRWLRKRKTPQGLVVASAAPQAAPVGRTVICPYCSAPNNAGSSNCVNCGRELPQGVSGEGRGGLRRSTSGGPRLNLPSNPPPMAAPAASPPQDIAEMPSLVVPARPPAEPAPAPKPPAPTIALEPPAPPPAGKPEPVAAEPQPPPAWQKAPTVAGAQVPPAGPVVSPVIPATWHYAPTVQKPQEKAPAERPVFCPECGLQQAPGAAVCPRCGFKVGEALTRFQGRRSQVVPAPVPASPPAPPVQTVREPGYTQREVREGRGPKRLPPGTELQRRYRIERAVAQGGMGAVYRAVDQHFKRPCAVKEMLDHFSKDEDREQALQWFEREAHLLLDLHHPAIPRVFDYFSEADQQYLVMEFVEGRTLAEAFKQEGQPVGLPEARVRAWAAQLCNVLAYLHRLKPPVIFRDLKPANVMVTREDTVKLIDFGIARSFQEGGQATVIMTIGYAPPEQMEGRPQPQSDLYALGSTLYRLLTGHEARDNQPTIFDFPPLRSLRSEVSPPFAEIIHKALKKNLDERWASASEMEQALLRLPPLPADTAM